MDSTETLPSPGGWNPDTGELIKDLGKQVDQAFSNVDLALRKAGGKGWEQVYKIRAFVAPGMHGEVLEAFLRNLKKWCPDHEPASTAVGVSELYLGMNMEIEVTAYLGAIH